MIALSMVLSIALVPVNAAAFSDIDGHWAKADIEKMASAGFLNGYPDGTFRPNGPVTRAEFAKIICEAYKLPVSENGWLLYEDNDSGKWYAKYASAFYCLVFNNFADEMAENLDLGVSTAFTRALGEDYGRTFDANTPLTRIEAAMGMIYCAKFTDDGYDDIDTWVDDILDAAFAAADIDSFSDSTSTVFAAGTAICYKIMAGDDKGNFRPYDTVSRAELCAILNRAHSMYGKEADPYAVDMIGTLNKTLESYSAPEVEAGGQAESIEEDDWAEEVLRLVNIERTKEGLNPLVLDADLCAVAQLHSDDMIKREYFSHIDPDGKTPFDRMDDYGIFYRAAGENIAWGQRSPKEVVGDWMSSPGHRANILNPSYNKMGIAHATAEGRAIYWTQCFTN